MLHDLAQAIVRQRFDAMIVDQRVHDCFLGGLHDAGEKRVHEVIWNCLHVVCDLVRICGVWIRSRKGDEQIARAISGNRSRPSEAERDTARESLQLIREQRSIRRDHGDARAAFFFVNLTWDFFADWDACDSELRSASEVRLQENADNKSSRRTIL